MVSPKRQVSFFIPTDLYKELSKQAIDEDISKTQLLVKIIKNYLKKRIIIT